MERRDFNFKIKSIDDAGKFTGMAATYNNVDLGSDRILPGAFTRTLSTGKQFPVLWQHQADNPIGVCQITDIPTMGLQLSGALELSDPTAKKAYTFMKSKVVSGLSIGYDTIQSTYDGDVRNLTELKLYEVSVVTFPMNEMAQIASVKSLSDEEKARHLKSIDMHRKAIGRAERGIRASLKALFDGGLDDDPDEYDDPALLENNEGDGEEEMSKAFLVELRKLTVAAQELA